VELPVEVDGFLGASHGGRIHPYRRPGPRVRTGNVNGKDVVLKVNAKELEKKTITWAVFGEARYTITSPQSIF